MTMSDTKIMENDRMIHKANQIAAFFDAYPHNKAVAGVAEHIRKFWTPPMRDQLRLYIEKETGEGLHELVIKAARTL